MAVLEKIRKLNGKKWEIVQDSKTRGENIVKKLAGPTSLVKKLLTSV